MPAALKPPRHVTIRAWYRATTVDTQGSEIISGGNVYVLRLRATQIEFARPDARRVGKDWLVRCAANPPTTINPLDTVWHHVVGVSSSHGMAAFFDGIV